MPSSGELRLRTLILALIALGGIWIALVIQRGHHAAGGVVRGWPSARRLRGAQARPGEGSRTARSPRRRSRTSSPRVQVRSRACRRSRRPTSRSSPPAGEARSKARREGAGATVVVPIDSRSARGDGHSAARATGDLRRTGRRRHVVEREPHVEDERARADAGRIRPRRADDLGAAERRQPRRPRERPDRPRVLDDLPGLSARGRRVEPGADVDRDDHDSGDAGSRSVASTNGGQIVVDNRAFFPTAVWAQCSDGFGSNIDDGINLFMGDGCSKDDTALPSRLDGRAYSIVNAENAGCRRPGPDRLVLPGRVGCVPAEHRHAPGARQEHSRAAAPGPHQLPHADEPLLQPRDPAAARERHVPAADVDPRRRRLRSLSRCRCGAGRRSAT